MAKKALFGNNIKPSCRYCLIAEVHEGEKIVCPKMGVVKAYDSCKKFTYDPLKRIPKKELQLANSAVNEIDF